MNCDSPVGQWIASAPSERTGFKSCGYQRRDKFWRPFRPTLLLIVRTMQQSASSAPLFRLKDSPLATRLEKCSRIATRKRDGFLRQDYQRVRGSTPTTLRWPFQLSKYSSFMAALISMLWRVVLHGALN